MFQKCFVRFILHSAGAMKAAHHDSRIYSIDPDAFPGELERRTPVSWSTPALLTQ